MWIESILQGALTEMNPHLKAHSFDHDDLFDSVASVYPSYFRPTQLALRINNSSSTSPEE